MDHSDRIARRVSQQRPRARSDRRQRPAPPLPKHPIINPLEFENYDSLFLMWSGAYGDTRGYVWARSADQAFETWVEWLDENAPGHLTRFDIDDYKRAAEDLGIEWRPSWPDSDDQRFEKVVYQAEGDHTEIGHTQLEHGTHIASSEWGFDEVQPGTPEYEGVLARGRYLYERQYGEAPNR